MLAAALAAWVAALPPVALPQDTGTVDAPIFASRPYGVSLPRPFGDWVFEPGSRRRTASVIFHPRGVPLRDQLWGALVATPYPRRSSLARLAEQRVRGWRRQLGPGFALLARDSLRVSGLPAMHIAVRGAVGPVGLEAEEYLIARRGDLIVLQFRYPSALPRDSIAVGYRRVLDGLTFGGADQVERAPPPPVESPAVPAALARSPWQAHAVDAQVHFDAERERADFAVRVVLVNDGVVATDSVTARLWWAAALDSVRTVPARLTPVTVGTVSRLRLPETVQPQASTSLTFFYHVSAAAEPPPTEAVLGPDGAYVVADWLPRVQPDVDSAGQIAPALRPRVSLRFDVPADWRAIGPGRLTSEAASLGRRLVTWTSEDLGVAIPAFALGPYRVSPRPSTGLAIQLWRTPRDTLQAPTLDSIVARVRAGWIFCSRAFGGLPVAEVNVVAAGLPETRGFAGLVLLGGTGWTRDLLVREVARSWWGNAVGVAGPGSWWIVDGFPAWAAVAMRGSVEGDSVRQRLVREAETSWLASAGLGGDPPLAQAVTADLDAELLQAKSIAALEAARRAAGEARFREALRSVVLEHRRGWMTLDDLLIALGPDATAVLRPFLF